MANPPTEPGWYWVRFRQPHNTVSAWIVARVYETSEGWRLDTPDLFECEPIAVADWSARLTPPEQSDD